MTGRASGPKMLTAPAKVPTNNWALSVLTSTVLKYSMNYLSYHISLIVKACCILQYISIVMSIRLCIMKIL